MTFASGALVRARGREWVVLPESNDEFLLLRPLGGTEEEIAGVHLALEKVEPATFGLPDPTLVGDYRSAKLLRSAVRLGFRSSAGPFRSFGNLAVEPRPYQIVPLLVALKLDPVRVLIADDVGIGKTIEASLIARELIDRGEVQRLAVLCPPPLAEQWQGELASKFNIKAELVLPGTAARLERGTSLGQSLFDRYPYVIVSTDYIKSDRRREEFLRTCPELVIVDEAHTCAFGQAGRGRHQRFQLISGLAQNPKRHMILVTATPHSGNEEAFRSLLTFLDPSFAELPDDLSGPEKLQHRRRLAEHFIQRRRADIRAYLDAETKFPDREEKEESYRLTPEYKSLFERALAYARESILDESGKQYRQRVRWWSALALLRSLASSPAAAAATLRNRALGADVEEPTEVDALGRRAVMDMVEDEASEGTDVAPGSDISELTQDAPSNHRRLLDMARQAEALKGDKDAKLVKASQLIKTLVADGFSPIVFCRFIPTAEYLAEELRQRLPKNVQVEAVTGLLPPQDREARVAALGEAERRVLVCTDCLSEGINLQDEFDAVVHYDLSWNPTRHEQREGRVDRFGQERPTVRTLTLYGVDNQIDGIVLDVLLRKHKTIRTSLGISVPVPVDADQVVEAIFEGLLLRNRPEDSAQYLPGFEEYIKPKKDALHAEWEAAGDRENRSRTMFAQETIHPEVVKEELNAAREAVGSSAEAEWFAIEALKAHRAVVTKRDSLWKVDLRECPRALRETLGEQAELEIRPQSKSAVGLARSHPLVVNLAAYVLDVALDSGSEAVARRCGAIRTKLVAKRTTLLLLRFRYHILTTSAGQERRLLAESVKAYAFAGSADQAEWLPPEQAERLFEATPHANIGAEQASGFVGRVIEGYPALAPQLDGFAREHGKQLLDQHLRVRKAARMGGPRPSLEPHLPPDVLGIYVFLPAGESS
jgi:superfamily II DNA or RNA helicase